MRIKRKILSLILTSFLVVGMMPTVAFAANGAAFPYVDAKGVAQTPVNATVLSGTISENIGVSGQETWYIVTKSATIAPYKKFVGTVNLILADGATLTSKMTGTSGAEDTLIIWGQEQGTGTFNATAGDFEAGIQLSGGSLVINGGTVNAIGCTGPDWAENGAIGENFKSITINGGTVNATATKGPAIGSDSDSPITITGGNITLNSPISGIQTGNSGSVTVSGGKIANRNGGKVVIKSGLVSVDEHCFTDGIDIVKDTPTVDTKPTASEIIIGDALSASTLTGGVVKDADGAELKGTFTWKDGTEVMNTVGTVAKKVVFTPDNTHYNTVEIDVNVTVKYATYVIKTGAKQEVTMGNAATFVSDADFAKFIKVQVDGKDVDSKYYTAEAGSTKITLKKEFIDTLSVGEHILSIASTDGTATTTFTVKVKSVVSETSAPTPNPPAPTPDPTLNPSTPALTPQPETPTPTPAPKPQPEKRIGMIPKTGESASFEGLLAALGFSIAGLAILLKKKMTEENNK